MGEALTKLPELSVRHNFRPGDIGYICYLHGILYARERGWDHTLEAYVAGPLSEFAMSSSPRQRIWIVEHEGVIVGTVSIVKSTAEEAQLRWLLVDPSMRGKGLGQKLVADAIEFCIECGYRKIFLWTVSAQVSAVRIYRGAGFEKIFEGTKAQWGSVVTEERYELTLG